MDKLNTRILLLDDDQALCELLTNFLCSSGFQVRAVTSKADFLSALNLFSPHLVILDKNLSGESGLSLIPKLRENKKTIDIPIIILSGSVSFDEKISAFETGADDILLKPVRLEELAARVKAALRRSAIYAPIRPELTLNKLRIDLNKNLAFIENEALSLTHTEYKLLTELMYRKGHVVNRNILAAKTLSARNSSNRTLDVHMTSLRKKMGSHGKCLRTVRGQGYMIFDFPS